MAASVLTSPAEILTAIRRAIARSPARIAVPFWGQRAPNSLGLDKLNPSSAKILCNLSTGGCNPDVIRELLKLGFQVRALSSLHAKVYMGATSAVLGSANASIDGLGLNDDDSGWDEACTRIIDPDSIKKLNRWFDSLWEKAADLSSPEIARILLEQADRAPPALRVDPFNLLRALKEIPHAFKGKSLFVTLDYQPYRSCVTKRVEELKKGLGHNIDAWEDWSDMPPAAELLSFYFDRRSGKISFEGIYQSPRDPKESMDPKTKGIYVLQTRRALGTCEIGDLEVWNEAVKRWKSAVFVNGHAKDEDLVLPLSKFAATYLP